MQILPIASGKGGVGKSLLSANLAIALAQAGNKVVITDLDLGASNIHIMLGLSGVQQGIGVFLSRSDLKFDDIVLNTGFENLRFIPGDGEIPGMANLKSWQKKKLIKCLLSLDADYIIADCGAGTNFNALDFFLISGTGIIVTAPPPTAGLNAYLFLKNCVFRLMSASFKRGTSARLYFQEMMEKGSDLQRVYLPALFQVIADIDPESYSIFQEKLKAFQPSLVLNLLEDPKEAEKADRLRQSCRKYLNVDMTHLGIIYRDDLQDVALNSRLPIIAYKPGSILSQSIYRIADKIMHQDSETAPPLDIDSLNDSYETAKIEAEVDFEIKIRYLEELMNSDELIPGNLAEAVKKQQYEIARLRRENNLLKTRLVKAGAAVFKKKPVSGGNT